MNRIAELDDPVSQLFLSCDLTGSTNFKQQQERRERAQEDEVDQELRSAPPWQHVFLDFYRDFPQVVAEVQRQQNTEDLNFDLWKPVGDELIYSCKVLSEDHVYRAVRTWIAAMHVYQQTNLAATKMGTKGGAFIATFPGPDSKSSVPRNPETETSGMDPVARNRAAYQEKDHARYLYDYFGPSIDTGFRVMGKCTPRYFTLSVEVTLAMIGRSKALGKDEADFHVKDLVLLHFEELKGVWHGRSYPVVAIDLEYDDPVNEAHALISPRGSRRQLLKLCRACYKDDLWPSWLYLPESTDDHFKTVPPDRLGEIATTSPEGVESEAEDEPENTVDLAPDAPLGETRYKTGVEIIELPAGLNSGEAEVRLRAAIQKKLDDDEYIARIRMSRRRASGRAGFWNYTAHWWSQKGKPTDSTAPTNIPYTPHRFDNP